MIALKGRGFQPRRNSSKISGGFSRRGELRAREKLFPQPFQPRCKSPSIEPRKCFIIALAGTGGTALNTSMSALTLNTGYEQIIL